MSVELVSTIFYDMISVYSEENVVRALIAGWDDVHGPVLFCIDDLVGCTSGFNFAVGSGKLHVYRSMTNGFHCFMKIDEAISSARWAILQASFQDGVAGGVADVDYVGHHGWELIAYGNAANSGRYYPIPMNPEDQEMTEEDTKWLGYLQMYEEHRAKDGTRFRICES